MVPSSLESFSLKFEGPWPGMISWLHSVKIGSRATSKTTHCSATSPPTLVASSQEAEGGLFPNPILQPFCHHIRVFSTTNNLFYGLQQSSGGRRVGTTGQRNVLSIGELGAGGGTGSGLDWVGGVSVSSIGHTLMGGVWNSG